MTDAEQQVKDVQAAAESALDNDDTILAAVAEKSVLQQYIDTLRSLVSEARIHFSGEGLYASAVDPANVAMFQEVTLSPQAFESYDCPGSVRIGVNLERFEEVLSPAGSSDLVTLSVDMESRMLNLDYGTVSQSVALIDPDAIRDEPDDPDIDLPNTVDLRGQDLSQTIEALALTGDHFTIEGKPQARQVEFHTEGDTDETVVTYGDGDVEDADVAEAEQSIFSLDYFEDLLSVVPDSAVVTVRFTDEMPMRVNYDAQDGDLTVRFMIAPRIQNS